MRDGGGWRKGRLGGGGGRRGRKEGEGIKEGGEKEMERDREEKETKRRKAWDGGKKRGTEGGERESL